MNSAFLLVLMLVPCLNADWLDPKKLKILPSSDISFDNSLPPPVQPMFSHNVSACVYRFHDRSFLRMKRVTLTNEEHFKGRTNCSVQFFNLPKGILYLTIGSKKSDVLIHHHQRCDGKATVKVYNVLKASKASLSGKPQRKEIGRFCHISEAKDEVNEEDDEGEIAANIEQKLVFSLQDWDGTSLHFRYKPFRMSLRTLYEDEDHQGKQAQTAWLVSAEDDVTSTSRPVNADFQYPEDCQAQGKFMCQQSVRCFDDEADADYVFCKEKKFLCVDKALVCDGKQDCLSHDTSDELQCNAVVKDVMILVLVFGGAALVCFLMLKSSQWLKHEDPEEDIKDNVEMNEIMQQPMCQNTANKTVEQEHVVDDDEAAVFQKALYPDPNVEAENMMSE